MLAKRREPELVPNYSLTGDLLSFMRCGLQYRYLNGSALPPSRPVQLWFGEFIHGIMETAYRTWLASHPPFPWPCTPTPHNSSAPGGRLDYDIGTIGDLVESTLAAAGKVPRSRDLRESAYERAQLAVNELGPALFPLIRSAEERVIGTRPMPSGAAARAKMYELHGIMDVLSALDLREKDNLICKSVQEACVCKIICFKVQLARSYLVGMEICRSRETFNILQELLLQVLVLFCTLAEMNK